MMNSSTISIIFTVALALTQTVSANNLRGLSTTNPKCFEDREELDQAIKLYMTVGHDAMEFEYGEIRNWCVSKISDFSRLFE